MPGPRALQALPGWVSGHQRTEPKVVAALRGEDWLRGGPAAGLGVIGDLQLAVSGADACGLRRYAGCRCGTRKAAG
jgi:hypothetical protein